MNHRPGVAPPSSGLTEVEWEAIRAAQETVPETFTDPAFRSIQHVSEIINSDDASGDLEHIRDWQTTLEGIVDDVVAAYHSSFSLSIKKHAQIVKLFEEGEQNLLSVRNLMNSARERLTLGAESEHVPVEKVWLRALVLRELAQGLDEIGHLTQVPGRIHALLSSGLYSSAVELSCEVHSILDASALVDVGVSGRDLRRECMESTEMIRAHLHSELMRCVFCRDFHSRKKGAASLSARKSAQPGSAMRASSKVMCTPSDYQVAETASSTEFAKEYPSPRSRDDGGATVKPLESLTCVATSDYDKIDEIVGCLVRLGDGANIHQTLQRTASAAVWELVHDILVYLLSQKKMVTSFSTSPLHATSQVSRTCCETLDIPDSSSVVDVISERLICIFKAVLSNLRRIGVLLSKHVPRAEVPTYVDTAEQAMKESFACIIRCFLGNTNGNVNTGTSDLHLRQDRMWWQVHSFDNTSVVTKPRSRDITGELESFTFVDLTEERISLAHNPRLMDGDHGRDGKTDDKRVEPSRARLDIEELSQAVTFTSNQLRSAAGISSIQMTSNEDFNISIVKFLSALRVDDSKESVHNNCGPGD